MRVLLGNLLEDSGSSVADDVVVSLHAACSELDSLHRPRQPQGGMVLIILRLSSGA
jgi:hypothetical protein